MGKFKMDPVAVVEAVRSVIQAVGRRVPLDVLVTKLYEEYGINLSDGVKIGQGESATWDESRLNVDEASRNLRGLIFLAEDLDIAPGKVGGVGFTSMHGSQKEPATPRAIVTLSGELKDKFGLTPDAVKTVLRNYTNDLFSGATTPLSTAEILRKYNV
jgi:hypothetical protein